MKKNKNTASAKDRLLEVAIKDFATRCYDGASIRDITKKAKVNISAISYYFGDKNGLYQAVLELMAKKIQNELLVTAKEANNALDNIDLSDEEKRKLLHETFRKFIKFMLDEEISSYISRIFVREHMDPSVNFNKFYDKALSPLHDAITSFLAKSFKLPFPSEEATLCAHTLVGMILIFKTHREAALRRLGWKSYGEEEMEKITKVIIRHLDYIVKSYKENLPV